MMMMMITNDNHNHNCKMSIKKMKTIIVAMTDMDLVNIKRILTTI